MSTDLYGIRVLGVAPDGPRVRFRVFVVYYDTADRTHAPLPDDPSFFFRVLWEAATYGPDAAHPLRTVAPADYLDPEWVDANTHRYVRQVERVDTRNHPVADSQWDGLQDFYYERDGRWRDEERLVRADYDVEVTDARWLGSLLPGRGWGTTAYRSTADQVRETDAPTVLDLRTPAVTLDPFPGGGDAGTPSDLAFSDDGRYLAVTSQACELVVLRTDDWSEHLRIGDSPLWGQDIQWVPGCHQLTKRVIEGGGEWDDEAPTTAHDIDSGATVEVPAQPREVRSRTGRYRADATHRGEVAVLTSSGHTRRTTVPGRGKGTPGVSFTGDETRMFVGRGTDVHVLDPASGRPLDNMAGIDHAGTQVVRPDGAHLATFGGANPLSGEDSGHQIALWRVADGALLMRCRSGGRYVASLGWSPDGTTLAASVITGFDGYGGGFHIYRAGSPVQLP